MLISVEIFLQNIPLPAQPVAHTIHPGGAPGSGRALGGEVECAAVVLLPVDEERELAATTIGGRAVRARSRWCRSWRWAW